MQAITKKDAEKYALMIAEELSNKKANDVIVIDVTNLTPITDYFIICDGMSQVQINVISQYVHDLMRNEKQRLLNSIEKMQDNPWILLDFGYILVNLFLDETRKYYNLEKLWAEGKIIYKSSSSLNDSQSEPEVHVFRN